MNYKDLTDNVKISNKPRVLLLNPPQTFFPHKLFHVSFPLGLCYIGTHLKNLGYQVKIVDTLMEDIGRGSAVGKNMVKKGLHIETIVEIIKDFAPDVLGISCNFHINYNATLEIAEVAKIKCNIKYVVVGGNYASVVPQRIMKYPFVDYLIIGEGERTFEKLLEKLFDNADTNGLQGLDGFVFRRDGEIIINEKTTFLSPEEFITPDRDLLPVEKYIKLRRPHNILTKNKRVLEVLTSRGCNANCTFCAATRVWGKFRARSAEGVISELRHLKEKYDIEEIQFIDDNLTTDKKRAKIIFQFIMDEKLNLKWCAPNGIAINTLDENMIKSMKQSGCYMLTLPIESGSQRVLTTLMKKPLSLDKIPSLAKIIKQNNISMEAFLLFGMPGETFEDIEQTFNLVFKLGILKVHFNYVMPIPTTPVYEEYVKFKINRDGEYDANDELYFDFKFPVISTREWTNMELKKYVSIVSLKFFLKFLIFKPLIFIREASKIIFYNPKVVLEIVNFYKAFIFRNYAQINK